MPIPGVDPTPPAGTGLHFFGLVQYIGRGRSVLDSVAFELVHDERSGD